LKLHTAVKAICPIPIKTKEICNQHEKRKQTSFTIAISTIISTISFMNINFRLTVAFYQTDSGDEPVRKWLQELEKEDKKAIGEEIKTVQFGWPIGMPVVRKLEKGLWEVRVSLANRIARILFTINGDTMVLLHGFIKKSRKTPANDLKLAKQRLKSFGD
jgi:phage-related protein